ncbi:phosphonate ABC transporter ATP-binding protein [Galactobacter valiniphilus]|uniref:Phosphonate ABC transporter ATP-binding protein n=1 Tax=Galactobacter valiniphilus TaxID=2676122 RepID=A0A399J8X6_9MICC|nr:phosphonate ABC transporter ATP-binding protein [Galactobacter valiniphilus]RII42033.1 phosphonate ABC transporter ATP-binding protein [Galactobacter valiniphilus]
MSLTTSARRTATPARPTGSPTPTAAHGQRLDSPVLVAKDLSVTYKNGHTALSDFTLDVRPGEVVALLGHSGSGKSTLMKAVTGLAPATATQLSVDGTDIPGANAATLRAVRASTGYVFQHFNLVPQLSALTNVLTGGLHSAGPLSRAGLFSRAQREQALALLARVGLADKASARADSLSGGQQQRVAIARALMQGPSLVLADEPVASLDPRLAGSVLSLLRKIAHEDGIPVIVSLHVVDLARRYADRFVALDAGRITHAGPVASLTEDMVADIYGSPEDDDAAAESQPNAGQEATA